MLNISQISEDLRISRLLIISLNLEGRNATLVILSMKKKIKPNQPRFREINYEVIIYESEHDFSPALS